jgi:hypothetical protein
MGQGWMGASVLGSGFATIEATSVEKANSNWQQLERFELKVIQSLAEL